MGNSIDERDHFRRFAVLAVALCAACSSSVVSAWQSNRYDAYGWLACVIWCVPVLIAFCWPSRFLASRNVRGDVLTAAVILSCLGVAGSVNCVCHVALIGALAGFGWKGSRSVLWLITGISWIPAFGWFTSGFQPQTVLSLRIGLATIGTLSYLAFELYLPNHPIKLCTPLQPQLRR